MLVVNDKELEDRNDSDISTKMLKIAEHGSFSRHTCYVIPYCHPQAFRATLHSKS